MYCEAGGGTHRTIWGFMKGFWPSDLSAPCMTHVFYIFCWKNNKIKICKFLQCVCFILRPVKRQKKWRNLVDHYKASIVACTSTPPSKSFTLYREKGGVAKCRTAWPGWCWQEKKALQLRWRLGARQAHICCLSLPGVSCLGSYWDHILSTILS